MTFHVVTPDGRGWIYAGGVWSWVSNAPGDPIPCIEAVQPGDPKDNWLMGPVLKWLDTQNQDEARICKDVLLDLWRRQTPGIGSSPSAPGGK